MTVLYFLVLLGGGGGEPAVVPQPFTSVEACQNMGDQWKATRWTRDYHCLKHEDTRRFQSAPVATEN